MTCSAPCRIGMFFFLSGCKICLFFCFASTQDSTVRRSKNLRLQVIINRFVVFCYFEAVWGPSRSRSDNYLIIWRRVISGPNVDLENQFPNLVIPKLVQPFSSHEFFFSKHVSALFELNTSPRVYFYPKSSVSGRGRPRMLPR